VYDEELVFANQLADEAAEIGIRYFRGSFEVHRKADTTPVTEADIAIEDLLRRRIAERFPGHAVLGEEQGLAGESERVWVIDPIDGTKNFAARIQIWGTLIALVERDRPVVGVVGAPALGERYAAARGGGSTLNGEPIRVSEEKDLSRALLVWGSIDWTGTAQREAYLSLAHEAGRTRAFGDFWSHALVARGAAVAMMEEALRI
jgi:histidinol-phosphatase